MTFYVYRGEKHKRIAILTINRRPTDYEQLKELLKECALKLWHDLHMSEAQLTLELHLPGKFVWKTRRGGYSSHRVRWRRGLEWVGSIRFNNKTEETIVKWCAFGPNLQHLAEDYYAERGIKYRVPKIIPLMHQHLETVKSLLIEPSGTRYADYSRKPHGPYDFREVYGVEEKRRRRYAPAHVERMYLPPGLKTREEEVRVREASK